MRFHPEILYDKYHFVSRVGWHLKIKKKCVQKWSKIDQKLQNVLYVWFRALPSGRCHGNACRINEVLILVFNRGDIWLFKEEFFHLNSKIYCLAKSEAKIRR